jgi:hypothetical protein
MHIKAERHFAAACTTFAGIALRDLCATTLLSFLLHTCWLVARVLPLFGRFLLLASQRQHRAA